MRAVLLTPERLCSQRQISSLAHAIAFVAWFASADLAIADSSTFAQSKHNLAASGTGKLRAGFAAGDAATDEMCVFCHTPHSAAGQTALWNRHDPQVVYVPYRSSTSKAVIGQPTGASRLCLSCHDGTVAMGTVKNRSRPIALRGAVTVLPKGRSNLGTDLTDDHPISFKYSASLAARSGELLPPPHNGPVHLDANGEMQCTTCHDPHQNNFGKFLVVDNAASGLCVTCHNLDGWPQSSHNSSPKRWNNIPPNPWPHTENKDVSANGCENCHDPHGGGGRQRLLNFQAEEQNCFPCHNGNVAAKNLESEFNKASAHPVIATTGVHDPVESALVSAGANRHVECADCHNPHAANNSGHTTPASLSGAFSGVRGVNSTGASVQQITHEYELCFRCHGDTARGPARVMRQFPQLNTRLEFQDADGQNSFHPVVQIGRNPLVPSLKSPWTSASLMNCGDCHNNDSGPGAGGIGPAGPHGSAYAPLLERPLSIADSAANSANSALCFKCHNFVNTVWRDHLLHINLTACTTCHDPHGSPNAHLINFDRSVVSGERSYKAGALGHGTCTLSCHGKEHSNTSY